MTAERRSTLNKELLYLILQFCNDEGYKRTAHMLERETGCYFDMAFFEDMVLKGMWDKVEKYLSGFTNVNDNKYSTKIYFEIRKLNFLEALDNNDRAKALDILMKHLKVFAEDNEELFREMTLLLTLDDIRENELLSTYGDAESSRKVLMSELKKLIEANPIFHGKLQFPSIKSQRLRRLINQGLNWQHIQCKYPQPNPDVKTLFEDHVCQWQENDLFMQSTDDTQPSQDAAVPVFADRWIFGLSTLTHAACNEDIHLGGLMTLATTSNNSGESCTVSQKSLLGTEDEVTSTILHPAQNHSPTLRKLVIDPTSSNAASSGEAGGQVSTTHNEENFKDVNDKFMDEARKENYVYKFVQINRPSQCQSLQLTGHEKADKISRLLYTNAGNAILALASNATHFLWKWPRSDLNSSGKATTNVPPQLWQPRSCSRQMTNDLTGSKLEEAVPCLALSKNDSYLLSASGGIISLFNMLTFKTMMSFMPPSPAATSLAFHPQDNNVVAIGMDDSIILIYNVRLTKIISRLEGHSGKVTGLAFSTTLNVLVSSGTDAQIFTWNLDGWEKCKSKFLHFPDERKPVVVDSNTQVQFHLDRVHFLVACENQISIHEAGELACIKQWVPDDSTRISQATFSCDSQMVYACFLDGTVSMFDASDLEIRCKIAPTAYLPTRPRLNVHPVVIAAHPQKSTQFAVGLTDGGIIVIEPQKPGNTWYVNENEPATISSLPDAEDD